MTPVPNEWIEHAAKAHEYLAEEYSCAYRGVDVTGPGPTASYHANWHQQRANDLRNLIGKQQCNSCGYPATKEGICTREGCCDND